MVAVTDRRRRTGSRIIIDLMVPEDIINGSAVGSHIALVIPLVEQYVCHQYIARAARLPKEPVIGRHYTGDPCLSHKFFKCRKICIPKVMVAYMRIKGMSVPFRTAVHSIMFGTG